MYKYVINNPCSRFTTYGLIHLTAQITINNCLLLYNAPPTCFGPTDHLMGRHLQRNTFVINAIKDVYTSIWSSNTLPFIKILLKMYEVRINYGILHLLIIFCLVADKHACHYWRLHSERVISVCCVLMFILKTTTEPANKHKLIKKCEILVLALVLYILVIF